MENWWKKLKTKQTDGKIYHAHGLDELMYYPRQSRDSSSLYQNINGKFHRTRTSNSKICMQTQKNPNSQNNLEKGGQS